MPSDLQYSTIASIPVARRAFRSCALILGPLGVGLSLAACDIPVAAARSTWTSYPSLAASTTSYPWLVVKCQLSNVAAIPAGLDANVQRFFGISGAGMGNMVDYFHDVSYNHASVISDTFVGWVRAPFGTGDLSGTGRLAAASTRPRRVQECLGAIPAEQRPDLAAFYGVVVINNAVQDGGACFVGQGPIQVDGKTFKLACVWFDPNSLSTEFAGHEIGHGLGLPHSYDDSQRDCGGGPGEYCDAFDIMSAQQTIQFPEPNFPVAGVASGAGPGLNAPGLLNMGWIPLANQRRLQNGGSEQTFTLRALSHPRAADPLVVLFDVGAPGFDGRYTVEYRQADGWDRGLASSGISPATVRASGGTVLVHQFRAGGSPTSTLINGAFAGALQPCNTLVLVGPGGAPYHVTVRSFDTKDGSAIVSVGAGRGKFVICPRDAITNPATAPAHLHVPTETKAQK